MTGEGMQLVGASGSITRCCHILVVATEVTIHSR